MNTEELDGKESIKQLAIIEKYEQVVNYLYPIFQNIPLAAIYAEV